MVAGLDSSGKIPMSYFNVTFDVDFGDSQHCIDTWFGMSYEGREVVYTKFADCITSCRSDFDCPTTAFTEHEVDKYLATSLGTHGMLPAKAIGHLVDGRYFFLQSWFDAETISNKAVVSRELAGLVLFSLTQQDREELGWDALGI